MRITDNILTTSYLRNLTKNLKQMGKFQTQLSSGKVVSKPSDNPMLVSRIMYLNGNIQENKQYNSNIKDTIGWVETQDTALNGVTAILHRLKDLVISGANGSLEETARTAIKDEVAMQAEQLKDILNANFDGRYIFGGQKTTEPPFVVEGGVLTYKGNENNITREIAQGVTVDVFTDGSRILNTNDDTAKTKNLGKLIENIIKALDEGDTESLSGDLMADIDVHQDNILRVRSSVGSIYNRLVAAQSRNESENLNLASLLSEKEDIDIAEKYMEYIVMTTIYQASLSVGAKVLQPSLLDYLR